MNINKVVKISLDFYGNIIFVVRFQFQMTLNLRLLAERPIETSLKSFAF